MPDPAYARWGEMPPNRWGSEMRINKPWYLTAKTIRGFEDPVVVDPPVADPPVADPPVVDPVEEPPVDTEGLKSALEKERTDRKALAKKVAAFEKAQKAKDDAEKTEIQRLTDADQAKSAKLQKLADGYRTSKVEAAIVAAAKKAEFLDPTDALRPEVIAAIGVEQDEDDPTRVTVDEASVTAAIKELAKGKPHWLISKKPPTTGSKFGGRTPTQGDAQQALVAQYPALARRQS